MEDKIVSDTGALITLEKMNDGFIFIRQLYSKIIIPPCVASELSINFNSIEEYLSNYNIEDLIEIQAVNDSELIPEQLHCGEKQAISLALKLKCDLLIEEKEGRQVSINKGLKIAGIAGLILKAFKIGVINKTEAIEKINFIYNVYRINKLIYNKVLDEINN